MLLATGDRPRASSVTAELEHSARLATPTARGLALRCRAWWTTTPRSSSSPLPHRRGPRPYLAAASEPRRSLSRAPHAGEATALVDEASAIYEGLDAAHDLDRLQSVLRSMCVRRPAVPPASVLRLGQPHAERAEGRRPHRRRAHEPGDRRAAVVSRRTVAPTSSTCCRSSGTPTGSSCRRGGPPQRHPRRSQQLRQHPQETEPALEGDLATPRRLTQPAGGSSTSSRIVISTRRSCPHGSQPASVT